MIRRCRVVLPAYFLPMGEVDRSAAEAGGPGLLGPGVHVAFVVVNHPGDVEIFPHGIVEGAVADVVDGPVPGENDDFGENVLVPVDIGLVQGELGPQGGGGGGAEAVMPGRVDAGVEGVHQFGDLVAAGGIDGVNVEAVVQHVFDGPAVLFRQDFEPLVKGGNAAGVIPQGLQGVEGQEVDHPFAAARAQGVLAGIELAEHEEHLVVQGQLIHRRGQVQAPVPGPEPGREEVQIIHPGSCPPSAKHRWGKPGRRRRSPCRTRGRPPGSWRSVPRVCPWAAS